MQRKQNQRSSSFECPPVFLLSDEGLTLLLSEVGPLVLDDRGDALGELADVVARKIDMDHVSIVIGDEMVNQLMGAVGRA